MPREDSMFKTASYYHHNTGVHGRNIQWWLQKIKQDRNYSRVLFGLPLIEPIRPGLRQFRDEFDRRHRPQGRLR